MKRKIGFSIDSLLNVTNSVEHHHQQSVNPSSGLSLSGSFSSSSSSSGSPNNPGNMSKLKKLAPESLTSNSNHISNATLPDVLSTVDDNFIRYSREFQMNLLNNNIQHQPDILIKSPSGHSNSTGMGRSPRVPFSRYQINVLENKFQRTHYLSSNEVTDLANELHLTETRVKIWFQNRRARERREGNTQNCLSDLSTGLPTMIKDSFPGNFTSDQKNAKNSSKMFDEIAELHQRILMDLMQQKQSPLGDSNRAVTLPEFVNEDY